MYKCKNLKVLRLNNSMITDFVTWLENDSSMMQQARFPASAEVIRTGKQPQLGADGSYDPIKQQEDHDKLMGIDSHIQRIKAVIQQFNPASDQGHAAKQLAAEFCKQWEQTVAQPAQPSGQEGLGYTMPSQQELDYMKNNQPLPEPGRSLNAPPPGF